MGKNIQIADLPDVDSIDKAKIDSTLANCYDKLQKFLNNEMLLKAHFKEHEVTGKRRKQSIHLHLSAPGIKVIASETGWNLITTLQKAVSTLERETVKKVKR